MGGFRVWPDSEASEICPIVILEPRDEGNLAMLGYDLFAEDRMLSVAKGAAESDKSPSTQQLLADESDKPHPNRHCWHFCWHFWSYKNLT